MTPHASSSTDLDLGGLNNIVPLPPITRATPPANTVRLNPNSHTIGLASHVQNTAQAPSCVLAPPEFGHYPGCHRWHLYSLGDQLNANVASLPGAIRATDSPSTGQQPDVMLCTRNFISMLGLVGGTAALRLRMAILSGAAATSTTGKDKWRLVQIILLAVVILVVLAATGEAVATLFVVYTRSTTQDDRDARRVDWRKWVKLSARCIVSFRARALKPKIEVPILLPLYLLSSSMSYFQSVR